MKIRYDASVDAAYIYFKEGKAEVTTVRLTEDVAVDFGPGEEVFGIEILAASQHLGFKPGEPCIALENFTVQPSLPPVGRPGLAGRLDVIRQRFPKAYEKWTDHEEYILRKGFEDGRSVADLATMLQRQPGAIESRLRRLGLVQ